MKKSNKKQAILAVLTLVLTLGLVGCGKGLVINTDQNINVNQNQNVNINQNSNSSLTKDEDGWNTYTNNDWGIRFKFQDKNNQYKFYSQDIFIDLLYLDGLSGPLYIKRGSYRDIYPNINSFKDYIIKYAWKNIDDAVELKSLKELTLNDNMSIYQLDILYKSIQHPSNNNENNLFVLSEYYIKYNNNEFDYISIRGNGEDIVNQVLESFEFIEN